MRLDPDYGPPIWLLDVDGVLCPYETPTWDDTPMVESVAGFQITWSPHLVQRIIALHESQTVEVRWCTSWGTDAAMQLAPELGLPAFTVAGERNRSWNMSVDWKANECAASINEYRPVVWTDDDAWLAREPWDVPELNEPTSRVEREVREHANKMRVPLLMLQPNRNTGLTPENMDTIETWLA
jgi:hypothetical protein